MTRAAVRLGSQKPTFTTVGKWHHTFGPQVARMFGRWGVRLYPCQADELGVFLARDRRNRFACRTIGITKPRQNGKSFAVRFYAIHCAAVEGRHVLFTAHKGSTVRKMFKFIRAFVLHTPDLAEKLLPGADGVYKAAGSEGIYFANGGLIEFATRTEGGGRGETYDIIIFDEAQELTQDQYDAIMPTAIASESGNPQAIYLGTPPGPKCRGTVFRALHDKAHSADPGGIWWLEWSVEEVPDMSDPEAVLELAYRTNPAMGYRIKEDVMLSVITSATSADGFAREYLNWWSDAAVTAERVVDATDWEACLTDAKPDGRREWAVKLTADGALGVLAVGVALSDGTVYVEVAEAFPCSGTGIDEMAARLAAAALRSKTPVVVDGAGNAQTMRDALVAAGLPDRMVVTPTVAQAMQAYSGFAVAVGAHSVRHHGQEQLTASVTLCGKRRIGAAGGYGFESNELAEAAFAEAAAFAHWRATQARIRPKRKMRIS